MHLPLETLTASLDRVRLYAIRALGPVGRMIIARRELRVAAGGAFAVITALLGTLLVPFWLLALGPILLGIPHLVADLRYLVIRAGWRYRPALWWGCGLPILAAGVGGGVAVGLTAGAGALVAARGSSRRRAAGLVVVGALVAVAAWAGAVADLVMAHAHNLIAIGLWWAWRRRTGRLHWIPMGLFIAGALLLAAGPIDPLVSAAGALGRAPRGQGLALNAAWLARGLDGAWVLRLVLLFAFAQSVHYVVWLRLVPDEDRERETPRTFSSSLRVLSAELGRGPMAIILLLCLALAGWAIVDLFGARIGYLRLATFHGYVEVAAAALLFMEGRPREGAAIDPGAAPATAPLPNAVSRG
jgi:hypothetical protein